MLFAGSARSPDLLDPFADDAENCLDQDMLMMCNRIQSGAPLLRIQPYKKHLRDGALQKHHVWDAMRFSSAVCATLVVGVLCCWFVSLIAHPSSVTVVAQYSDAAYAKILLVTVLVVEPSLSHAGTQSVARTQATLQFAHFGRPLEAKRRRRSLLVQSLCRERQNQSCTSSALSRSCKDRPTTGWRRSCRLLPQLVIRSRSQ